MFTSLCSIRGLVLLGAESPIEALPSPYADLCAAVDDDLMAVAGRAVAPAPPIVIQAERPAGLEHVLVVHSALDAVVPAHEMTSCVVILLLFFLLLFYIFFSLQTS